MIDALCRAVYTGSHQTGRSKQIISQPYLFYKTLRSRISGLMTSGSIAHTEKALGKDPLLSSELTNSSTA